MILSLGERLGLADLKVWRLAAEHLEGLKKEFRLLPSTLNYNDFDWANLALSREETPGTQAIVFDYHLLGVGPVFSDYRNVIGSLGGKARDAFQDRFGPVDEREILLDAPLSTMYSLYIAAMRPQFPAWAKGLIDQAISGQFERDLRRAVALLA